MELFFQQLTNGVALGSVYALMAIGFTLIFGVLRLLNMAHGELYMLGAYMAHLALTSLGLPAWVALPLALIIVFFVAIAVERVAFKPLRNAPHFIPLVSTIAVSTIVLESIRLLFGPYMFGFDSFIPAVSFSLGGIQIGLIQISMFGLSLSLMIAVQLFLGRTQWGKAIMAVSQDTTASGLLGINVDRIIGFTFAIGSVLGAVAGILVAMHYGAIYPTMGFVALVKAFTAAILGGMGSVPGAVLGGFLLGIAESLGTTYLPSGMSDAVPFLVLFAVLLFLPNGLTGRGKPADLGEHHSVMQISRSLLDRLFGVCFGKLEAKTDLAKWTAILGSVIALAYAPFLDDHMLRILITIVVYGMMALGTNLILGISGQLSLSHAAFFALGAYSSAILTKDYGFGFLPAMLVGIAVAAASGFFISLMTFRVRGYYLALVTLAFAELVRITIAHWNSFTGGMMGVRAIPAPAIGGFEFESPLQFFYLSAFFCALAVILYDAITYSVKGRSMMALRDDEMAARASGIAVQRLKITAFTLSAIFAAVGGSLMAHYYSAITPDLASLHETVTVLLIAVVGGLGSAAGALLGSAVVNLFPELFRTLGDYRLLAYGVILFVMILYQPSGVFSISRRLAWRA
ncbi:ABC transporter permease [Mesorhizobium sp. CO1-1-8]|uniref:ABC transporter permease n=1 Tax=Mesorhizobium sp. CO1-1-8 TaxID=2876631 RepID=UPI001CD05DF2|nr:ABC transporter permease [Mesorhizobium sp. CO1-1-8]MBZ9772381.1 ABC transporter permease [Mesorhizobium sp. CO1-1-8]